MTRTIQALVCAAAALGAPLAAATPGAPIVLDRAQSNGCGLVIADAGRAMLVRADGLIPGESYRFTLTDGDMKPVDFAGYANAGGSLIEYYNPFRFGHPGGVVEVQVAGSNCTVAVSAPWTRGVPVIR